jgi:arsenate reductase
MPGLRHVLFVCTGNATRSIMAEAILNHRGAGRFQAHSAGSMPAGVVSPRALDALERHGVPVGDPWSKSWDVFTEPGAPAMDFIVTVCDNAAGETCPVWPGHPASAHWGVADPTFVRGTEDHKRRAFDRAFATLDARISRFVALPFDTLDAAALKREIAAIADVDAPR